MGPGGIDVGSYSVPPRSRREGTDDEAVGAARFGPREDGGAIGPNLPIAGLLDRPSQGLRCSPEGTNSGCFGLRRGVDASELRLPLDAETRGSCISCVARGEERGEGDVLLWA